MNYNTVGVLLSRTREKKQLKLEEVCEGICSPATLSRIEGGSREADSLARETLLGRIGREVTRFELVLGTEGHVLNELRMEMRRLLAAGAYDGLRAKIAEYRALMPSDSGVHEQFARYIEWQAAKRFGSPFPDEGEKLLEALSYTLPGYLPGTGRRLYSPVEIALLRAYANVCTQKRRADMENELLSILRFIREFYSSRQKERVGVPLYLDLIRLEMQDKRYAQAIAHADGALAVIAEGRSMKYVGELHFLRAKAIYGLGSNGETADFAEPPETENWETRCRRECLMAYCVFDATDEPERAREAAAFSEEKLGWQITRQMMCSD